MARRKIAFVSLVVLGVGGVLLLESFGSLQALSLSRWRTLRESEHLLTQERRERERLELEIRRYEGENAFLKERAGLTGSSPGRVMLAEVLAFSPPFFRHSLVIDKGSVDGVVSGMIVVLPPQTYVGRIEEVSERTARVETPFHPASRIIAETKPGGMKGLVQSRFGSGLLFSGSKGDAAHLERNTEVVTASGSLPAGLLVGRIRTVEEGTAFLEPALDERPSYVFLVKP